MKPNPFEEPEKQHDPHPELRHAPPKSFSLTVQEFAEFLGMKQMVIALVNENNDLKFICKQLEEELHTIKNTINAQQQSENLGITNRETLKR